MGTKKQGENMNAEQVNVTAADVRRLLRPRDGFMAYVEPMLTLYDVQLEVLRIAGLSSDAVRAKASQYRQLLQHESELQQELELTREARWLLGDSIWRAILDIYARAQSAARHDSVIRHAIGGLATFLKRGHKRATPTTTTPASTAT